MEEKMKAILEEIKAERRDQNEKFGEQNHLPIEWIAILSEEVGEASKEAVDHHFQYPYKEQGETLSVSENHIVQKIRLANYRKELIQIAALAIQMIESHDRNNAK